MSETLMIPDCTQGNDLYTPGQYQVYYGVRQIVMFNGSSDRLYPQTDESDSYCDTVNHGGPAFILMEQINEAPALHLISNLKSGDCALFGMPISKRAIVFCNNVAYIH